MECLIKMVGIIDDVLGIFNVGMGGELFAVMFIIILLFFIIVRFAGMGYASSILGVLLIMVGMAYSVDLIVMIGVFIVSMAILNFIMSLVIR